jgi:hypothetical protein
MGVMAAFFARVLRRRLGRPYTGFLLIRQEGRAIDKPRNQVDLYMRTANVLQGSPTVSGFRTHLAETSLSS